MTPFDPLRIAQLLSPYDPGTPPAIPLDFGDYLSLVWRLERATTRAVGVPYYRRCEQALAEALKLTETDFGKLVKITPSAELSETIPQLPYRGTERRVDAADRGAAIRQLWGLRSDVLKIGSYGEAWHLRWPGSGIEDSELRDRVFAMLFTALPSQFAAYARLLLVSDIVLQELLIGTRRGDSFLLHTLIRNHGYPDPAAPETPSLFLQKGV